MPIKLSVDYYEIKIHNSINEYAIYCWELYYCLGGLFMKEKILIGAICALILVVVGIGSYVALVPTIDPVRSPDPVVTDFPENELPAKLGIQRPNTRVPRIFAVRNYEERLDQEEINQIDFLKYYVLDGSSQDHILVVPFDIGGRITVTELMWDDYEEEYVPSNAEDAVLIDEEITPGYALLLQYDRPSSAPEYQIKVTQGATTATYNIEPNGNKDREEYEYVKSDE